MDLNQTAFYFYGTRMKLIRRMTTDLFILFTDNQGKRKSDPLSSFYPPHPCAIENTKPFSSFLNRNERNSPQSNTEYYLSDETRINTDKHRLKDCSSLS